MTNPTLWQKKNGQYLWFSLLGMGFQPDAAVSSIANKTSIKHLNLGPNMFDRPNKDAFYIVTHFLLEKFNPTRFQEAYRHCWPVLNHKADAEFRKVTCSWIREIMDDAANAGSKVVPSLFLSPGGPKFISLMLHLANRVILQEMKTLNTDGSWVPEAAAAPTTSADTAVKRFNLIRTRFLRAAVDQDRFLHEYQRRAQGLVKSMRDVKAEGAKYDELLKRCSPDSAEDEASRSEKIKKVRSLWSDVEATLSAIGEERAAMEAVLKGDADQRVLDGTGRVLRIPRCLQERIEQLPHQLNSGSVYEAGQLNLLCVAELSNHALRLLKEEQEKEQRGRASPAPAPRLGSRDLQEKCRQMTRVLQELHLIRQKLSKEEIPEIRNAVRELEADWDKRWTETLKGTPLVSFLKEDPALGFLSPMAPLSFEPAAEAAYRSSVFSQFPAKLPEEKPEGGEPEEEAGDASGPNAKSFPTTDEASDGAKISRVNTSLDWLFDTPPSPPQRAPPPLLQASVRKTSYQKVAPSKTRTQILDLEYENLADQFADAVTTSPSEGRGKGSDLENLLSTLQRDPFSAKKQLPRTPESLIMEVKSSWRKAVEEDEATRLSPPSELDSSPDGQPRNLSVDVPSLTVSCTAGTPVCQQGAGQRSSLLWDTFHADAADSPSGTGSSAVQFSLDTETLPELPSCDSPSLEDGAAGAESEEDEGIVTLNFDLPTTTTTPPRQGRNQRASGDDGNRTTPSLLLDFRDEDWLMQPGAPGNTNKVFSLDLDSLDTPSPGRKQEFSLPKLITFSPIDDMKC
ncbi:HAUS augmin-like complex subunit 6 [Kryptolebias marmoratus]|uniref:HAUS augmin like complex subunit 6 n=1 Tax=Kryptolebias marmoratus TaxID=37003 RepID=A0A3Q2ZQH7_KRYMA|nr:HAUS augmin-like complex subunit 6 [Kryptolebias marmoratus]